MAGKTSGSIYLNAIICILCGDRIVSEHRHDFKWCKCKAVAVDGGLHYLRRIGVDWQEASFVWSEKPGQVEPVPQPTRAKKE